MSAIHRAGEGIGLLGIAIVGGLFGLFPGRLIGVSVAPEGRPGHELEALFDSIGAGAFIGFIVGAIGLSLFASLMFRRSGRRAALSPPPSEPQTDQPPYWPPPPGSKPTPTQADEHERAVLAGSREADT